MAQQHSFTVEEINALDAKSAEIAQLFSVKGKVAVVTGGSRGIGLMIAHTLVANGAKVFIVARDGKVADAAAEALTKKDQAAASLSRAHLHRRLTVLRSLRQSERSTKEKPFTCSSTTPVPIGELLLRSIQTPLGTKCWP
eukprot:TRINITY_DN1784_c0_g1_i1.p1 TRINITY_DN1784_c0_g1~~TRINITY_DN1784_c0_g1_i1.p1  ORF type:complete len:148 (-),score=15.16 TRINITY_DN1784_c0_g1_i1:518-937(-)